VLGVWVLCTAALRGDLSRDPRDMHGEHYHDLNAEEEGMRESRAQFSNVNVPISSTTTYLPCQGRMSVE
jgi:hypothetical protein